MKKKEKTLQSAKEVKVGHVCVQKKGKKRRGRRGYGT